MQGVVAQVSISSGGIPKLPVRCAEVSSLGIVGDQQRNRKYHGGPRQALLLVAAEVVDGLIQQGWPLFYGALGENLTSRGLDHSLWRPGQRFRAGGVILELTKPRTPCKTLDVYGNGFQNKIHDKRAKGPDTQAAFWGMSGFYASVIRCGVVSAGDILELLDQVV